MTRVRKKKRKDGKQKRVEEDNGENREKNENG